MVVALPVVKVWIHGRASAILADTATRHSISTIGYWVSWSEQPLRDAMTAAERIWTERRTCRRRSKTYRIDPDRLAVGGGSAELDHRTLGDLWRNSLRAAPEAVVCLWGSMYGQEKQSSVVSPCLACAWHSRQDRPLRSLGSHSNRGSQSGYRNQSSANRKMGGSSPSSHQRYQNRTILESVTEFLINGCDEKAFPRSPRYHGSAWERSAPRLPPPSLGERPRVVIVHPNIGIYTNPRGNNQL